MVFFKTSDCSHNWYVSANSQQHVWAELSSWGRHLGLQTHLSDSPDEGAPAHRGPGRPPSAEGGAWHARSQAAAGPRQPVRRRAGQKVKWQSMEFLEVPELELWIVMRQCWKEKTFNSYNDLKTSDRPFIYLKWQWLSHLIPKGCEMCSLHLAPSYWNQCAAVGSRPDDPTPLSTTLMYRGVVVEVSSTVSAYPPRLCVAAPLLL